MTHDKEICKHVIDIGREMAKARRDASKHVNHVKSYKGALQTIAEGTSRRRYPYHNGSNLEAPEATKLRSRWQRSDKQNPPNDAVSAALPQVPSDLILLVSGSKKSKLEMIPAQSEASASNFRTARQQVMSSIIAAGQKAASLIEEEALTIPQADAVQIPKVQSVCDSPISIHDFADVEPFSKSQMEEFQRDMEMQEVAATKPPKKPSKSLSKTTTPFRGVCSRKMIQFEMLSPNKRLLQRSKEDQLKMRLRFQKINFNDYYTLLELPRNWPENYNKLFERDLAKV